MKKVSFLIMAFLCCYAVMAQKAIVEESSTDIVCDGPDHAIQRFREATTILNEHGAAQAAFVCSCSKNNRLTSFKGLVTDGSGRVIRKMSESDLKKTEYSPYLAIDDYKMYLDYTPSVYPVTITYEWTIESRDNVIEFPRFCPQTDYDISVKKATYNLRAPRSMGVRHALQNIDGRVIIDDSKRTFQIFTLQVNDLPPLQQEPFTRPLRERLPMAWFAPTSFVYFGTKGSQHDWTDFGKWQFSLMEGRDRLTDTERQELHQLTDGLNNDREKVKAIYQRLGNTTRYVAILLGIGGQQPAPATSVSKSGYGDCKGLTNYMRAMLKEVGITSYYTIISTTNHQLRKDFASVGQMNHVILKVPLRDDTLWLECTNPQLPLGYVHEDIAGHDAIEVSEAGGRMVQLPEYADSTHLMHTSLHINLEEEGAATLDITQEVLNQQYEHYIPLLKMNEKERQKILQQIVLAPQAEVKRLNIQEEGAKIALNAEIQSQKYATRTGQRLFVPICPVHSGYSVPSSLAERTEDIWCDTGYLDTDDITITIPEGYVIEARPGDVHIELPLASFTCSIQADEKSIHVKNRLLMRSGTFDKSLFPKFIELMRTVASTYRQKIVLKNK